MDKSKIVKLAALFATCGLLVAGCETRVYGPGGEAEVEVNGPPPAPVDEVVVGTAPGPGYVWVGGGWGWHENRWVMDRGHWDRPPRAGVRWEAGRYEVRNGHHYYHAGHWR